MPFPDATGWVPQQELAGAWTGYDPAYLARYGLTPADASNPALMWPTDGTPPPRNQTVLPQEFWPSEESYNFMAEQMRARGIEPPPRGTLDNAATQQLGRALYEESQAETRSSFGMGSPGWAALVAMGGAAAGGAFANGGAGYGAGAGASGTGATTYPLAAGGPVTATPLAGGAAGGTAAGATGGSVGFGTGVGQVSGAGLTPAATGSTLGGIGATGAGTGLGASLGGAAATGISRWLPYINSGVNTLLGVYGANQAADAEQAGLQAAIDEQRRQYDLNRQDLMPWLTAGQGALNNLQDPNAFTASPGYEWTRNEGQRDIGNSFAARGGAASGNALRALAEFNTGLAAQDYNNWWNRQAGLAGVGQNTAVNLGATGSNTAANVGNYLTDQGASRASGVLGKYGAIASGLTEGIGNWLYSRSRRGG